METNQWLPQLRRGLVDLTVMRILRDGEAYGYEILQRLAEHQALALGESTVYPLLGRLAEAGHVSVRLAPSPSGPPRRYYTLTNSGRLRLAELIREWKSVTRAVATLLE